LGLVLVALAVVNRKPVTLGLNPFDGAAGLGVEAPLFLFLLGAFASGLVVGGFATWLGQGKWRLMARTRAREASNWRRQADRLEKELEGLDASRARARLPAD
jgi:uncharacterized integral membrane protein